MNGIPEIAALAREARESLSLVPPPTPESTNPLYYALLFLVEGVELHARSAATAALPITPERWERTARKAMAMYDWTPKETTAINDFILTANNAAAELLSAGDPSESPDT